MTREQKLALIVGFSLVLLVGVLISDHLSRARQAKVASVSPSETPAPAVTQGSPNDTLRTLDIALRGPGQATPPVTSSSPTITEPQPVAPTTIAQGTSHSTPQDADIALRKAVEGSGGQILVGKDGIPDIIVPGVKTTLVDANTLGPAITNIPRSSALNSPITDRKLATNEQFKTHTVQKGETLFQIAGKYYGTGHVWRELARFNGVADQDGIVRTGSRLKIPSREVLLGKAEPAGRTLPQAPPAAKGTPARRPETPVAKPEIKLAFYTVKKGETLGEISKKLLGSSKRWQELAEFNKLEDEDSIAAGTVLKVPPMRG